jgi:hypothetical protein
MSDDEDDDGGGGGWDSPIRATSNKSGGGSDGRGAATTLPPPPPFRPASGGWIKRPQRPGAGSVPLRPCGCHRSGQAGAGNISGDSGGGIKRRAGQGPVAFAVVGLGAGPDGPRVPPSTAIHLRTDPTMGPSKLVPAVPGPRVVSASTTIIIRAAELSHWTPKDWPSPFGGNRGPSIFLRACSLQSSTS